MGGISPTFFFLSVISSVLLVILFLDIKSGHSHKIILRKFCRDYNLSYSSSPKSLFSLNKNLDNLFSNHTKSHILFHAKKNIKHTEAELYLTEMHLASRKNFYGRLSTKPITFLCLEIINPKFKIGEITIFSKPLAKMIVPEKPQKAQSSVPGFALKFDITKNPHHLSDFIKHIDLISITNLKFPIGIMAKDNSITFVTTEEHLNRENLEKIWQVFDWINPTL